MRCLFCRETFKGDEAHKCGTPPHEALDEGMAKRIAAALEGLPPIETVAEPTLEEYYAEQMQRELPKVDLLLEELKRVVSPIWAERYSRRYTAIRDRLATQKPTVVTVIRLQALILRIADLANDVE